MFKVDGVVVVSWRTGTLWFWEQSACQVCAVNYVKIGAGYMDRERETS